MGCELSDNSVVMYLLMLWPSELAATLPGAKVDFSEGLELCKSLSVDIIQMNKTKTH